MSVLLKLWKPTGHRKQLGLRKVRKRVTGNHLIFAPRDGNLGLTRSEDVPSFFIPDLKGL